MGETPNVQTDDALRKAGEIEKKIGSWAFEDTITDKVKSVDQNLIELRTICNRVKEKAEALEKGFITQTEFRQFAEKFAVDIKGIQDDLLAAKNAVEIKKARMPISDWRVYLKDARSARFLTTDSGVPESVARQKAFALFNLPIEKDSAEAGYIKSVRDMHDYLVFKGAILRSQRSPRPIQSLPEWETFRGLVKRLDPEFAEKAMYSTGTALGDEWVPTIMSSEMEELYRLQPTIESWLRPWTMPSNPADYPIKVSGATAYRGSEAAADNPPEALKSAFGTGKVTFTAEIVIGAIPVSPELIEDSLVDMVGELRAELVLCLADGFERGVINGDTAATHQDTVYSHAATALETGFLGFRAKAFDDSKTFDTQSASAGVGDGTTAFAAKDIRYNRSLLGVAGKMANELLHICNLHVWFLMMSFDQVAKANEAGRTSTWVTGGLENIDGVPIYVTENMSQTQATTGLETGASTYSSILTINRRIWTVGTRRGVMVEFEKNVKTQQLCFVATTRKDLQPICASTVYPAAVGFKIA